MLLFLENHASAAIQALKHDRDDSIAAIIVKLIDSFQAHSQICA